MDLGPHAVYIVSAYGFAAAVFAGFILNAIRDNRAQKRALAEFQGESRR